MVQQDDETRALLRRNLELTKENNRLLKKMHRSAIINRVFTLLFWLVAIGVPVYVYIYFIQPSLVELIQAYQGVQSGVQSSAENFQNVLQNIPFVGHLFEGNASTTGTTQQ